MLTMITKRGLPYLSEQIREAEKKLTELKAIIDDLTGSSESQKIEDNKQKELWTLSKREIKVLNLIGVGKSNKEIARMLKRSKRTIETHRYNIQRKLGITPKKLRELAGLKINY